MTRRFGSIVGDDQMPAPDGPQRVVPLAFLPIGFASAPMVYVFHSSEPVDASSATRLPRNVQHSYFALLPCPSSPDATGTYKRFSNSVGAPVTRALACSSRLRVQITSPVDASIAYAFDLPSPKYAAPLEPRGPIVMADRTAAFAWKIQIVQPVAASSA